jgi:hypothetical protein
MSAAWARSSAQRFGCLRQPAWELCDDTGRGLYPQGQGHGHGMRIISFSPP